FHLVDPALAVLGRAKVQPGRRAVRHHRREALSHAVRERLVELVPRTSPERCEQQDQEKQPGHAFLRKATTSFSGSSRGFSSRLPLYSALPAASPRSESTRR